ISRLIDAKQSGRSPSAASPLGPSSPSCEIHHLRLPPRHSSEELAMTCSSTRHISTSWSFEITPRSPGRRTGPPYSLYQMIRHPVSSLAVEMSDSGTSSVSPVGDRPSWSSTFCALPSRTAHQVIENPMCDYRVSL